MKRSSNRWTPNAILILAVSVFVLTGAGMFADSPDSKAGEKRIATVNSCPTPTADFSKKERKTMTTAVQKGMIPLIDKAMPAKVETATFGLG